MTMQTPNDFKTVVLGWIDQKGKETHTALPGKVVSYDAASNRASVQPEGLYKAEDGSTIPYPVIYSVPVVFPCGMSGKAGITFPIYPGDGVLLVFSETQMDDFLTGGDSDDPRSHSLNDAIAVPGLYSGGVNDSPDAVCLRFGGSKVLLDGSGFHGTLSDGTSFSFAGGDLVVNGISLVHHVHGGIEPGPAKTGQPE